MHGFQHGDVTFNHHGDFSGDIIISVPETKGAMTSGGERVTVEVPFEALLELVGRYYYNKQIEEMEQTPVAEFAIRAKEFPYQYRVQALHAIMVRNEESPLDEHVHDVASEMASRINNNNVEEQFDYLVEELGEEAAFKIADGIIKTNGFPPYPPPPQQE